MDDPRTTPGSWRVFRELLSDRLTYAAHLVRRSPSQVEKWTIPPPSADAPHHAGDINPLDFLISILRCVEREKAQVALDWLCLRFGGRFVPQDGGSGDGLLFRDLPDAVPHLKALLDEIKKKDKASDQVMLAHLEEVFCIITAAIKNSPQRTQRNAEADREEKSSPQRRGERRENAEKKDAKTQGEKS